MKERSILFSGAMVRAILEGRKTQTRRVIKLPMNYRADQVGEIKKMDTEDACWFAILADYPRVGASFDCPFGIPGDRLWVRESWHIEAEFRHASDSVKRVVIAYSQRDSKEFIRPWDEIVCPHTPTFKKDGAIRWNPSIHMPRWASRITLEITDVRVQRLRDISEEDAEAEGVGWCDLCHNSNTNFLGNDTCPRNCGGLSYREEFEKLWDSINATKHPWSSNPWVWAIAFRRAS